MQQETQHELAKVAIGSPLEGGFFGGIINVNGQHKAIIWAPKKLGSIKTHLLNSPNPVAGAGSPADCLTNTRALLAAGSPAAEFVTSLTIDGHNDWLIPSRDVLELGYRHFKPTAYENYASWRDGENANSIPPGWIYTPTEPAQTQLEAFRAEGEEAFDAAWHWSSTVLPQGDTAFFQFFHYGCQDDYYLHAECRVRAVRLIQL